MMNDIGIDKTHQHYIIKKMISLAITATYFIFCRSFILVRFNPQNWLTFWSKENSGYESIIIAVR